LYNMGAALPGMGKKPHTVFSHGTPLIPPGIIGSPTGASLNISKSRIQVFSAVNFPSSGSVRRG
jgi:hypothetical protein